jgi:hypothetical protein
MAVLFDLQILDAEPLHFKNPYKAEEDVENIIDPLKGMLWNTGMAVTNQAHAVDDCGLICGDSYMQGEANSDYEGEIADGDEEATGEWGYDNSGLVAGEIGPKWERKHIAAIRLYKNNEYIYLLPGDELKFYARSYAELAYYLHIKDSNILQFVNRDKFMVPIEEESDGGEDGGEDGGDDGDGGDNP